MEKNKKFQRHFKKKSGGTSQDRVTNPPWMVASKNKKFPRPFKKKSGGTLQDRVTNPSWELHPPAIFRQRVDKNLSWPDNFSIGCLKGLVKKSDGPNRLRKDSDLKFLGFDKIPIGPHRFRTGLGKFRQRVNKNPAWPDKGFIGCPRGLVKKSDGPSKL